MASNTVKIAISLPKKDFQYIEILRKKLGISRSRFIDKTIKYWLKQKKQEELIHRYQEGYKKKPEKVQDLKAIEKTALETLSLKEKW